MVTVDLEDKISHIRRALVLQDSSLSTQPPTRPSPPSSQQGSSPSQLLSPPVSPSWRPLPPSPPWNWKPSTSQPSSPPCKPPSWKSPLKPSTSRPSPPLSLSGSPPWKPSTSQQPSSPPCKPPSWKSSSRSSSPSPLTSSTLIATTNKLRNNDDLFMLAKSGSAYEFDRALHQISAAENAKHEEILSRVSPGGNMPLHLAAKHGNLETLIYMLDIHPVAIFDKNLCGETALYLASEAGHAPSVIALVKTLRRLEILHPTDAQFLAAKKEMLIAKNLITGDTALLAALSNGRELVAECLIREFPDMWHEPNKLWETATYLATKAGFLTCLSMMVKSCTDEVSLKSQFKHMSPFKVAIMMKNTDVLNAILSKNKSLIHVKDDQGKTPLHYAASLGDIGGVRFLLDSYEANPITRDDKGRYPIHLASIKDHVDIISLLHRYYPIPGDLLDNHGNSILHFAAMGGSYNVVKYILKNPGFEELINMKNEEGNTALHLATMHWHPKIVSTLTWDKRVDVKLLNQEGMTALDTAEDSMFNNDESNPLLRQHLTWTALKSGGTPRSPIVKKKNKTTKKSNITEHSRTDRVNTLLLVSTLVATITFAAGFTMPGGYNSSPTDLGMATLLRRRVFHLFVFCDTIAMHCSIFVVVALIFAQLGDLNLILTALRVALPLLGVALSMMSLAFTAGISLVVGNLRWLSVTVLVLGFTFLAVLLFLFLPLCTYASSSNQFMRYLSYYSFWFLMWASRSYD